jgi:hypothetical protein
VNMEVVGGIPRDERGEGEFVRAVNSDQVPLFWGEGGDAGGCWSRPQYRSPTKSSSVGPSSQSVIRYSTQEKE